MYNKGLQRKGILHNPNEGAQGSTRPGNSLVLASYRSPHLHKRQQEGQRSSGGERKLHSLNEQWGNKQGKELGCSTPPETDP